MLRVILYIVCTAAAALVLGIGSSSSLLGMALGFGLWAAAGAWGFEPAIARGKDMKATHDERIAIAVMALLWPLGAVFVALRGFWDGMTLRNHHSQQQRDRLGRLFDAATFVALGLGLFVVGLAILDAVMTTERLLAVIFGPACLVAAWRVLKHNRRQHAKWRDDAPPGRLSEGGHGMEVLAHGVAFLTLATAGVVILAVAL